MRGATHQNEGRRSNSRQSLKNNQPINDVGGDEVTPRGYNIHTWSRMWGGLRCRMHTMWRSPPSNLVISGHCHFVKRGTLRRRSAVGALGATGQQPLSDCRLVNGPPETLRQLIGLDLCMTDSRRPPSFSRSFPGYIGFRMVSNLLGLKLINTERGVLLLLCCFIG